MKAENTAEDLWNHLTDADKRKITVQAHGEDSTKNRIKADIDSLSPYSCLSEKTKRLLEEKYSITK